MNWGAMLGGALALIAVQKLTASAGAAGAVSGIAGSAAAVVKRFLDPHTPLWSNAVLAKAGGGGGGITKSQSNAKPSVASDVAGALTGGLPGTVKAITNIAGPPLANIFVGPQAGGIGVGGSIP